LTRDRAIPVLSQIVVAMVTGTVRGLPTEVPVGPEHGLDRESVINCDNLFTVSKSELGARRGDIDGVALHRLRRALRTALDLD